ncbi:carbonic anhydrase 1 [Drosophila pseudoobscura]|uniref:Carbonic anhydrase 1 n=1 Tax=Drosophila pseudoobscura pseudoobscura TaxID=46245 RepID=A0A6I8UU89_DROPS|nr:carbonic anhydrase 1 [Drosophila pseudoobscura]
MLSPIIDFWLQFMQGFNLVMEYVQHSAILKILVSCIMSLAFLNIVRAGGLMIRKVAMAIAPKKQQRKLAPQPTPINIVRSMARKMELGSLLDWKHYDDMPLAMLLENNGSTVILRICCEPYLVPQLSGGDLPGEYHFVEACFKWGPLRAEHSIDSMKFSLEMQVLHRCNQDHVPFEYVTVSYLFVIMGNGNGPLTTITENLRCIARPDSQMELPAFDLASLMKPFDSNFYSYEGTYDNGAQVLPTKWLICTYIFAISSQQVSQFSTLCGRDGTSIHCNARKEQPLGNRSVNFHIY